ncbi:hemagglutinin repeat-containing protein [Herbaspirillum sp. YR522]|uniref:hemagglutinin repeat-containing protein n=1 Tax=Herbaspirillum sp. YR522 TaxID=1144342 RepID=UPI00026F6E1C|nr:hemagglutinin repeat-containing protein [Herbaspirillum sp. YR522]EJN01452.1 filamentous hemagglutinin family N-terminal domain containing protein [Herbaspirillum sp. YR522]
MNQFRYRIVFNKTRGMLMAVAETARSGGGTSSRAPESGGRVALPMARLSWIGLAVLTLVGTTMTTQAQIVADPSAPRQQQAVIVNTANGVPQVNIQTPSAAGVSRNTYSQFDVQRNGAVLNNSRSDVQSQLGGWIQRNPNLANGTARVIVNEVNSSNPSYLRGFVEVAGDRAQVIIANPSGVTCDGCGFINSARTTLTTGEVIMNGGNLDGYVVRGGRVRIEGAGFSDAQSDFTEIIARAIEVNAGIWAKELHVTAGTNQVSADHSQVTPVNAQDGKPAFGVDVAQLGGMYANKIFLVGTESGVGMRNAGKIGASVGEVMLTADGRIENSGTLSAQDKMRIQSAGIAPNSLHGIVNTGSIGSATSDVTLNSDGRLDNGGSITAQAAIDINAKEIHNSGTLSAAGSGVSIAADAAADNSGAILAQTEVRISGADVANSGTISAAAGDVNVVARGAVANGGSVIAQRDVTITAQSRAANGGPALSNTGSLSAMGGTVAVKANGSVANAGTIVARDDVRLDLAAQGLASADLSNSGNLTATLGQVSIHADGSIDNGGSVIGQTAVSVVARHTVAVPGQLGLSNAGTISVAGGTALLDITGAVDNAGKLIARDGVQVRVSTGSGPNGISGRYGLRNAGDIGASAGNIELDVDGGLLNTGAIIGKDDVTVATRNAASVAPSGSQFDIDNSGSIQAADGQIQLTADGRISNSGAVMATQSVTLDAANIGRGNFSGSEVGIANTGTVSATAGAVSLKANGNIQNNGTVAAQTDLTLDARNGGAALYNAGKLQASTGKVSLTADGLLDNTVTGFITANQLGLSAQEVENSGSMGAQADASLVARSGFRQASAAALVANGNMVINVAGNYGNAGQLRAATIWLSAAQISNIITAAIQADSITINGSSALTNAGEISARGLLDITASQVDNTGVILGDDLVMRAQTVTNTGNNALLGGGNSVSLWVSSFLSNRNNAVIYSAGNMSIAADAQRDASGLINGTAQVTNEDSIIEAGGNLDIAAVNLRNTRSGVAVTTVRTLDETYAMRAPSWWHNGGNEMYYKPDSSNFNAYEILYVNPSDVLESRQIITPDGYVIGRAVIRTHANDTAFYKGISSNWAAFGQISRASATDGTRVVYFTSQIANVSNPDKVAGGDDPRDGRSDVNWEPMPGYSNQYGNCTTDCIRFVTEQDYTDPNAIYRQDTQHILAPQHDSLEVSRNAHHIANEDRLAASAGAASEIRAGGNASIRIGQSLSNEFSNIVVNGALWLGGASANITNLGQTLYRRHSFDGTFTTAGGTVTAYSMPDISEAIGTTQGAIVGNGGVTIVANNFSNTDLSAGSAANIRNDITPATGSGQSIGTILGGVSTRPGSTAPVGGALPSGSGLPTMSGFPAGALFPQNGNVPVPIRPGVLFQPSASGSYLLETRSQFTDHRTWLSSDYLLTALNVDPGTVQKRLGDGYYEQRLVREQIAQLTGKVSGAANDDSQYQQLLTNGVSTAQAWGLRPGVELSADQVSHLTSDIVWLVSQTVTMPDGSTQDVLVPRVYLAHIDDDALQGTGALVSGANVTIQAANITNKGGMIDGRADGSGRTVLVASNDLANLGGGIAGDDIVISAGGSVRNETLTTTQTYANGQTSGSFTSLSNQAGISAGKNLTVTAGGDIDNIGATLASGRSGDANAGSMVLSASRDVNFATVKTGSTYAANFGGYTGQAQSVAYTGATVNAGGDLSVMAQRDIAMTAAQVNIGTNGKGSGALLAGRSVAIGAAVDESVVESTQTKSRSFTQYEHQGTNVVGSNIGAKDGLTISAGVLEKASLDIVGSNVAAGAALGLSASDNVNIVAMQQSDATHVYNHSSSRSFLSSRSSTDDESRAYSNSIGSSVAGDSVSVQAGNNIAVAGSAVLGVNDVLLKAGGSVDITSTQNTDQFNSSRQSSKSGFAASFGAGVASFGYGSASADGKNSSASVTQQASTLASLNGNLQVQAGQNLSVTASDLGAGRDLTLIARNIDLSAAQNTSEQHSQQQSSSSGFSVGFTYNPLAAFKNAYQQSANNNPAASFIGKNNKYAEAAGEGASAATTPVVVQAGSRSSNSTQDHATSTAQVSTLTAGNNLTLLATDGDITSQGAVMSAEGDALLLAKKNILLDVARSFESQDQTSNAKGWSLDNRGSLPVGMLNANGNGDGTSTSVTGTTLSAGRTVSVSSTEGDITLTAANLVANGDLSVSAARNLTVQSGQDVVANTNRSDNQAIGKVVISDTERFAGYHTEKSQGDNSAVTQVASNLASLAGNVSLSAGDSYGQQASNVLAANNVDITAKSIDITTADNTGSSDQSSSSLKIGAFARVSSPLIDLVNNIENARKSDGRLQVMQGLAAAANGYQAFSGATGGSGSIIKGEVGIGFASANSQDNNRYTHAQGSTIQGGNNVNLTSTQGDIHATGASIAAGETLTLDSARNILLDAAQSTATGSGDNHSAGLEVGVGYSVGAQTGVYAYLSASIGNGKYDYNALTNSNTHLSGDAVVLKSAGDTTLKGADVNAGTIDAAVGGKLAIESVQDKVTQHSEQNSIGGRAQISIGTAWEASSSASRSTASGSSSFVNQQSGLFAREGGYHVTADSVALKGGVIGSTDAGKSELTTNSISFENLENKMEYSASTMSLSGGISGGGKADSKSESKVGEEGSAAQAGSKNSLSNGAPTPNLTPGIILQDNGSDSSTAYATLTGGKINIGGQTTTDATSLGAHTDLATANSTIEALPDLRNVMKEQQAMAAAANTVIATTVQIAGDIAKSREKDAQTKGDLEEAKKWGPTGEHTRDLKTVVSVLVGALAGQGPGQLAATAAAPYLANAIGNYFSQPGNENQPAQVLSHALLGGILAAANGGSAAVGATAGAVGELAAQAITKELYPHAYDDDGVFHADRLSTSETQTVIALSAAAGALVGALGGGTSLDTVIGTNVATNAVTNNYLTKKQILEKQKEIQTCNGDSDCVLAIEKKYVRTSYLQNNKALTEGVMALEILKSQRQELSRVLENECAIPASCHSAASESIRQIDEIIAYAPTRESLLSALDTAKTVVELAGTVLGITEWAIATRNAANFAKSVTSFSSGAGGAGGDTGLIVRNGDRLVLDQRYISDIGGYACGPTACAMVLNDNGKWVNITEIAKAAGIVPGRGTDIISLTEALQNSGLSSARWAMNATLDDLAVATSKGNAAIGRILLENGEGHFVVIDGVTVRQGKSVVAIRDPGDGSQYFLPVNTFTNKFGGQVVFTK